ncbi:hypothetical protein E2C01_045784 [Portunus trituberculatus]|uniref:Uncharacterized protein n=1 Tax=Portunus trituberculatus TaxID=210409 RepID=A0A5B7G2B1_PORTR|nr:hypothetical protein [Portunus trituberculatus]
MDPTTNQTSGPHHNTQLNPPLFQRPHTGQISQKMGNLYPQSFSTNAIHQNLPSPQPHSQQPSSPYPHLHGNGIMGDFNAHHDFWEPALPRSQRNHSGASLSSFLVDSDSLSILTPGLPTRIDPV